MQPDGRLQLVALEYVVIQAAWDAAHSGPPTLFGQTFMLNPAGNRFGLPAFYALHAWIWSNNPSGTFNPWNPRVGCSGPITADAGNVDQMDMTAAQNKAAAFTCAMPADAAPPGRDRATNEPGTPSEPSSGWAVECDQAALHSPGRDLGAGA